MAKNSRLGSTSRRSKSSKTKVGKRGQKLQKQAPQRKNKPKKSKKHSVPSKKTNQVSTKKQRRHTQPYPVNPILQRNLADLLPGCNLLSGKAGEGLCLRSGLEHFGRYFLKTANNYSKNFVIKVAQTSAIVANGNNRKKILPRDVKHILNEMHIRIVDCP